MRIEEAAEHAMAVAREAVQLGLADRALVKQLYRDYAQRVQQQGDGESFAHMLLEEGAIDQGGLQQLLERCPLPAQEGGGEGSRSFRPRVPREPLGSTHADEAAAALEASAWRDPVTRPQPGSGRFSGEDWGEASSRPAREPAKPAGAMPDLTMAYEDVLPAPEAGENGSGPTPTTSATAVRGESPDSTIDFDAVLETPSGFLGEGSGWASAPLAPPLGIGEEYDPQGGYDPQDAGCDTTSSEQREGSRSRSRSLSRQSSASQLQLKQDGAAAREAEFFEEGGVPSGGDGTLREPEVGEVMGDYQLERVLGRGGMGVIFLSKKIGGGEQRVALKALTVGGGEAGAKRRARFQREVEALRRLQHPNIVKVHDCGRKGPWDWYAMEYVEGQELKALIKEGQLERPQRLQVFLDICAAVHHAHERGVIHRDLKPANVLVTAAPELRVCVLDFGLAKLADEALELTKTGAALGTPYYMAPEQLLSPRDVDHRSDVWSLGVLLYEMLVGERPFTGETAGEVGNKIMQAEPVRPSKINPSLHASLDTIVLKALCKDPAHRYQDVEALRRDVAKFRRGSSLRAMTDLDAGAEFVRRWLTQHRTAVVVGFLLASLVYWPAIFFVYAFM